MRKVIVAWTACCVFLALSSHIYAASSFAGAPEYDDNFAARNPATGQYTALERVATTIQTRVRAFGFGGAEAHVEVPGEASPVRFKSGQPLEFVIKVASQERDPLSYIQFVSLVISRGQRTVPEVNIGPWGVGSRNNSHAHDVIFTAAKFGPNFFRITSNQALAPGEYLLSASDTQIGFCFGVDP